MIRGRGCKSTRTDHCAPILHLFRDSFEKALILLVENCGVGNEYDLWLTDANVMKSIFRDKGLVDGGACQ
jgi:hypothetical protein